MKGGFSHPNYPGLLLPMCFYGCRSSSLPLGSQIISVAVNSSLSWHTNRLRDVSRDAYNVSYAWKLVSAPLDLLLRLLPPENPDSQLSWERLHHAAPAVRDGCRSSSPPVPASVPSVRPEKFVFVGVGGKLAAEQQNGPSRAFVCLLTFSRFGRRGNITFDSGSFCLLLLKPLEPEPNHANCS